MTPVAGALLLELALHVRDHAAGDLAVEDLGLDADELGLELRVARADLGEVVLDLEQPVLVQPGGVAGALEHLDQGLGGVVAGAQAERARSTVSTMSAPASIAFIRLTIVTPVVECTWTWTSVSSPHFSLIAFDDVVGRLGPQQRGHVLDADRVAAHVLEPLGHLDELLDGVQRAEVV